MSHSYGGRLPAVSYVYNPLIIAGNRHAVVGTKEGTLEVVDIGAGEVATSIEAHTGAVWAVTPLPDNSGLVSGSADHEAKFWEWEVSFLRPMSCVSNYSSRAPAELLCLNFEGR